MSQYHNENKNAGGGGGVAMSDRQTVHGLIHCNFLFHWHINACLLAYG